MYFRSCYSLLESTIKLEKAIAALKKYGYKKVALVDHNTMSGAFKFYEACLNNGLKPLFGLEFTLELDKTALNIVMYAKDDIGFRNLNKIATYLNTEDKKITCEILKEYLKGNLVAVFSDNDIFLDDLSEALRMLDEHLKRYVIAFTGSNSVMQRKLNAKLKEAMALNNVKGIVADRAYYLSKEDEEAYAVLKAIKDKKTLSNDDFSFERDDYLKDKTELNELYEEEELILSDRMADSLNVKLPSFTTSMPDYYYETKGDISDTHETLRKLAHRGLLKRLSNHHSEVYEKRLNDELAVIIKMDFANYFLIVYDFVNYAKRNGIMVGPGRGSACGSLVSYALHITDIDPIKYNLYFERFLNPERISMPDIDIDFPDDRRDEVISYVRDKYGSEHVAHIVTYGTLQAKQVLRDVARVLDYQGIDVLCKTIPADLKITLRKAYETSKSFKDKIDRDEMTKRLFRIALKLEGLPRHYSTHAAGIVMAKDPLKEVIPLLKIENDLYSTAYTMEELPPFGLIKMDFLGLRNLSIIDRVSKDINKKKRFNIRHIPLDDPKTFDLIAKVNTLGVFQLESGGMQNLIKRLRPQSFEDIALTIALFRPGPMQNIPEYLANRNDPERINYLHPDLYPILKETSGIIVYQEQIMAIAQKMASFSFGKADIMRKAMSKKKLEELSSLEDDFIEGCLKNGYERKLAKQVYDLILKFANYGFNKSHSIAYALIAYEEAYLKANYPLYFYKALLNGAIGSTSLSASYLNECQSIGIKILPPDINLSENTYEVKDGKIIMPLSIIKNIGSITASKIIEERNANGVFKDFISTISRLRNNEAKISNTSLESLIYAGAFDRFGFNRTTMINNLKKMLDAKIMLETASLFGEEFSFQMGNYHENTKERIAKEKEVLGFIASENSLFNIKRELGYETKSLYELGRSFGKIEGFGIIKSIREYTTRTKEKMCFITVYDDSARMDLSINPSLYFKKRDELIGSENKYIYFKGSVNKLNSCRVEYLMIRS